MTRLVASRAVEGRTDHSSESRKQTRGMFIAGLGVGLAAFAVTEFMHYLLVADLGRRWERFLAQGVSALVVALLAAKLMQVERQRREANLLRLQVISEMNHHIRGALAAISLSTDAIQNDECIRSISESVDRIEWALREVLLRRAPFPEDAQTRLRYLAERSHKVNKSRGQNAIRP